MFIHYSRCDPISPLGFPVFSLELLDPLGGGVHGAVPPPHELEHQPVSGFGADQRLGELFVFHIRLIHTDPLGLQLRDITLQIFYNERNRIDSENFCPFCLSFPTLL